MAEVHERRPAFGCIKGAENFGGRRGHECWIKLANLLVQRRQSTTEAVQQSSDACRGGGVTLQSGNVDDRLGVFTGNSAHY